MQSTNCTAYIAPEVGLSVLVNRTSRVLPCRCVSPHCKAGATQSIFLAKVPAQMATPGRPFGRLPPFPPYLYRTQIPIALYASLWFIFFITMTHFLVSFIFAAWGTFGLYNGFIITFCLLVLTCILSLSPHCPPDNSGARCPDLQPESFVAPPLISLHLEGNDHQDLVESAEVFFTLKIEYPSLPSCSK